MEKHSFKIGDKVKLKDPKLFLHLGTKILTIIGLDGEFIIVKDKRIGRRYFPLYPIEIEYVVKVGEQLLFNFMEG